MEARRLGPLVEVVDITLAREPAGGISLGPSLMVVFG
jgi:hypothetical protein